MSLFSLAEFGAILAFCQFLDWYFEVAGIRNGGDVGEGVQLVRVLIWILAVSKNLSSLVFIFFLDEEFQFQHRSQTIRHLVSCPEVYLVCSSTFVILSVPLCYVL